MRSVGSLRSLAVCVVTCVAVTVGCSGDDDQASQSTLPRDDRGDDAVDDAVDDARALHHRRSRPPRSRFRRPRHLRHRPLRRRRHRHRPGAGAGHHHTGIRVRGTGRHRDVQRRLSDANVGHGRQRHPHRCSRVLRTGRDRVRRTGRMPGVRVEYVDDPVLLSPSDETVEIDGDATLVISVAAWMPSMEGDGYAGPTAIRPDQRRRTSSRCARSRTSKA